MPNINIIVADKGWILERIANEIIRECKENFPEISIHKFYRDQEVPPADLTYYLPYNIQKPVKSGIIGSWFTHRELSEPDHTRFITNALEADFCVSPAKKYKDLLEQSGAKNTHLVHHGVDLEKLTPKLTIGVVGRTYKSGRKGEDLVFALQDEKHIEFKYFGDGWPQPSDSFSMQNLVNFYHSIDYLLIPSRIEGGPIPFFEAMACGVEVIAGDVGCVKEFPHIPFETGNADDLKRVIHELLEKKSKIREAVKHLDWSYFAREHLKLFQHYLNNESLKDVSNLKPNSTLKIALVMHGNEQNSKGGPSTRVGMIQKELVAQGQTADLIFFDDTTEFEGYDIIHIFNSWAPSTALRAINKAAHSNAQVVFSPIALNLSNIKIFQEKILKTFEQPSSDSNIKSSLDTYYTLTNDPQTINYNQNTPNMIGFFHTTSSALSMTDALVFLSQYEQDYVNRLFNRSFDNTAVIPNGIDIQQFEGIDSNLFKRKFGVDNYFLIVGRIESRKNQLLAAYALKELDVSLVLIGHVGASNQKYYELIKKSSGQNLIHIERIDDNKLLNSAYLGAQGLILNSWAEGAPLTAIEAGCCGTPLILSTQSGEKEYFGDFADYVHPCDIEGLKNAVQKLITSPETQTSREKRATYCKDLYSIQKHTEQLIHFYKTLPVEKEHKAITYVDTTHTSHALCNGAHLSGVTNVEKALASTLIGNANNPQVLIWNSNHRKFYHATDSENPFSGENVSIAKEISPFETPAEKIKKPKLKPANIFSKPDKWFYYKYKYVKDHFIYYKKQKDIKGNVEKRISQPPLHHFCRYFAQRSRYVILGQGWISNDRYTRDIVKVVTDFKLNLELLVHDTIYYTELDAFDEENREAYINRLKQLLRIAKVVYCTNSLTHETLQYLKRTIKNNFDIVHLPLGLTKSKPANIQPLEAQKFSALKGKKYVLYVSSFNARKNHQFISAVWSSLMKAHGKLKQEYCLVFVGKAQHGFEEYKEHRFKEKLKKDNIFIFNDVSDDEIDTLYEEAEFTLYPSKREGFGIPILESLQYGKLVLTTDKVPAIECVNTPAVWTLQPDEFFQWFNALHRLLTDEKLLKFLSNCAKNTNIPDLSKAEEVLCR